MAKSDLDTLRDKVAQLSNENRQLLKKLERQGNASPELTFAKIAEMLDGMPHVDHVLLQLQSHAYDYQAPGNDAGTKQKGWQHDLSWRIFIRSYPEKKYADVTAPTCIAAIKLALETVQLPMPAGLEKLAQSLEP